MMRRGCGGPDRLYVVLRAFHPSPRISRCNCSDGSMNLPTFPDSPQDGKVEIVCWKANKYLEYLSEKARPRSRARYASDDLLLRTAKQRANIGSNQWLGAGVQ